MRFGDLLRMGLTALTRHKVRTVLTVLGVMVGSLILMISLSVGLGVRHIIDEQFRKEPALRQIHVYELSEPKDAKPPQDVEQIFGRMSPERRERLREERARRWKREQKTVYVPLTPQRLREIAGLNHVVAVTPSGSIDALVTIAGQGEQESLTLAVSPTNRHFQKRLIEGRWLNGLSDRGAVVSEYLLYEMGVRDEADVPKMLGRKIRLELQTKKPSPVLLLSLLGQTSPDVTEKDRQLLQDALKQLPEVIKYLKMDDEQRARLKMLLAPRSNEKQTSNRKKVSAELEICGVVRVANDDDPRAFWVFGERNADVVLSADVGKELLIRSSADDKKGLSGIVVEVDDTDNVPDVVAALEDLDLKTHSFKDFIQQQRLGFILIFSAMTLIALVALLVSALGITNTMLMSVLERVREIGVMKAVGARDSHVQRIFLVEGALIGIVGGALGALLTLVSAATTDAWTRSIVERQISKSYDGSLFVLPWWLIVGVPVFVALVTTLAAVLPARRAARVNPVTALRHE